jgi:hypothetical protein
MQLVITTAVLAGCARGPESTAEKFYKAVAAGEITEAQSYLSAEILGTLGPDKTAAILTKEHKQVIACGGIKSIDVSLKGEGEVRFGSATVSYRGECPEKNESIELVREEGKWKIGMNK